MAAGPMHGRRFRLRHHTEFGIAYVTVFIYSCPA